MATLEKKHFDAAKAMTEIFIAKLGLNRAVHCETVIAAAARMAGTLLFRTFGFDTTKIEPGTVVLSEEANEKGPRLLGIVGGMLQRYGLELDPQKLAKITDHGEAPRLTVTEMQALLEADLNSVREKFGLSLEGGAQACALAAAWWIKESAPTIGLEVGFNIAQYGLIEGCKTAPLPLPLPGKRS